ncbi:MAG: WG repeat-containing protein [Bacillota bacterium]|nr:WG repeat-containing protein [Bacillota bacterium]
MKQVRLIIIIILLMALLTACEEKPAILWLDGVTDVSCFTDGMMQVSYEDAGSKSGYVDADGKLVIRDAVGAVTAFMCNGRFADGRAKYMIDDKLGYIDKSGAVVIPAVYDDASVFVDGLAVVRKGDREEYIDADGKTVLVCPDGYFAGGHGTGIAQHPIYRFSEELALITTTEGTTAFVDRQGKVAIPENVEYELADLFAEGFACVVKDLRSNEPRFGFIDKSGQITIPIQFEQAQSFSEGLAAVRINGKWGFIDRVGAIVIPAEYDWVRDFEDGLAVAAKEGICTFIDSNGAPAFDFRCDLAFGFRGGFATVSKDERWGVIDRSGNLVTDYQYDYIGTFDLGVAVASLRAENNESKQGIIDSKGNVLLEIVYDQVHRSEDDPSLFVVRQGERYGIFRVKKTN